ncbi:ferric reductase-like transmembrane domain-containing protein [uncultured Microbacterium sp.]|uniref:ferredoxin reductase family protein n=1 Tax=uncultured Microbacterium sp. TaxID=191216 RepID=UPI0025DF5586|nr:ferric reductase-like transmembrane domain-containing protein [uncultured Microbacterium sp.]
MNSTIRPNGPSSSAPEGTSHRDRDRSFRRRERAAVALIAACWVSVIVAVMLFLASGRPAQIAGLSDAVTAAGIVTGLIGTDLLLVMLVLAARIPWVDRTFGQDAAIRLHRRLGKPAVYLILGHGALIIVGYSLRDGLSLWHQTLSLLSGADMLLAWLGTGLLVVVVVTSLVVVRRRLAHEVWHAIHLISYAAVLVAVPHQLSAGQVLAGSTPQTFYWTCLYVLAFGSIAWFRFAAPLLATEEHQLRVVGVEPLGVGVFSIHLSGRDLTRLGVRGGQYAIWRFWSRGTWWHAHPISFSAMPTDTGARLTVRALGAGTERLARLKPGTRVSFAGPYGVFTDAARSAPRLAVVAAGIGITPARALLEDTDLAQGEATVVLRATDRSQAFLWDETKSLVERSGGAVVEMVGRRPSGASSWMSADAATRGTSISTVLPDLLDSDLFVCGPGDWTDLVVAEARAAGLADRRIHVERFA